MPALLARRKLKFVLAWVNAVRISVCKSVRPERIALELAAVA